jgi:hypothetical protein
MRKKVLIFDTSVLCVWLKVPRKETCGPDNNPLTFDIYPRRNRPGHCMMKGGFASVRP